MASCDASDVQVKNFSPVKYRRTREKRKDDANGECEAKKKGLAECPPDLCRCSGVLRKRVETPVVPWGTRGETAGPDVKPPDMTPQDLEKAAKDARTLRANLRPRLIKALDDLIAVIADETPLGLDEIERKRELEEWRGILAAEK